MQFLNDSVPTVVTLVGNVRAVNDALLHPSNALSPTVSTVEVPVNVTEVIPVQSLNVPLGIAVRLVGIVNSVIFVLL